jgi:hypothetical protein
MAVVDKEKYLNTISFLPHSTSRNLHVLTSIMMIAKSFLIILLEDFQFR